MIRKKLRNLNGNDDNDAVDMEMSDEDLNLSGGGEILIEISL